MKTLLLILVLLSSSAFSQIAVFQAEGGTTVQDTSTLKNTTEKKGRLITLPRPYDIEGAGVLWVTGDLQSGSATTITVKYRTAHNVELGTVIGDTLWSQWSTLDSTISTTYTNETFGSGNVVDVYKIELPLDNYWMYIRKIQFSFTGTGTHVTRIAAALDLR